MAGTPTQSQGTPKEKHGTAEIRNFLRPAFPFNLGQSRLSQRVFFFLLLGTKETDTVEELRRNARGRIRHRERCEGGHRPYPRLYFEAIRDGHLSATKVKREGRVTKVKRDVLIEKASLDKWLKVRFYLRGGTDDLSMIALSEAAELAQCREGNLLHFVGLGELTGKENPEGRLVLDRAKFMVWLEGLPPHCDTLDPNVRWWTVLEI